MWLLRRFLPDQELLQWLVVDWFVGCACVVHARTGGIFLCCNVCLVGFVRVGVVVDSRWLGVCGAGMEELPYISDAGGYLSFFCLSDGPVCVGCLICGGYHG